MKRKGKILMAILLGLPALLVVATSILLARQWRQDRLDNALFQALLHRNLAAATTALNQGANPDATYKMLSAMEKPSGSLSFVEKLWNRLGHHPSGEPRYPALLVPIAPRPIDFAYVAPDYARIAPLLTLLLQHGADPNVADLCGTTPLLSAANANDMPTVRLLLEHKANPNAYDAFDHSSLCYAVQAHNNAMVLMLLEHGADPNKMDGDGSALIQMMIADDNVEGAAMLLDHGADANHVDERSFHIVLAEAIGLEEPDMVRLLLRHGASIGVVGRYNETALELARRLPKTSKHRATLIRLLEEETIKRSHNKMID